MNFVQGSVLLEISVLIPHFFRHYCDTRVVNVTYVINVRAFQFYEPQQLNKVFLNRINNHFYQLAL